jgi:hypothetical protein
LIWLARRSRVRERIEAVLRLVPLSGMLGFNSAPTAALVTPAQARERFGAFGAYYLPAGGGQLVTDTVTIVNVFRKILPYYFGADLTPEPDRLYMSLEDSPFDLVEVDPVSLR